MGPIKIELIAATVAVTFHPALDLIPNILSLTYTSSLPQM